MAGGQQPQENDVPVYLFTGFLEAGKTKFIQETLEDTPDNHCNYRQHAATGFENHCFSEFSLLLCSVNDFAYLLLFLSDLPVSHRSISHFHHVLQIQF